MKDFGEILHEEFNKVEEYYVPDEKEHIIWDSEISDDDFDMEQMKDLYKDYCTNLQGGEAPEFDDWFEDYRGDNYDVVWDWKEDDLKENILPEIDKQLNYNYLMLCGGYNSNYPDFRPSGNGGVDFEGTEEFRNYMSKFDRVAITSTDGVLGAICGDHDGTVAGQFYTLPEKLTELAKAMNYQDQVDIEEVEGETEEDRWEAIMDQFEEDILYGGLDYSDFKDYLEYMVPIKDTISSYGQQTESKKLKTEGILKNIQQEDEIDEWKVFSADIDTNTEQGKNLVNTFKDYEDDVNNVITGIRIDYNTETKNCIVCYIDNNGGFHNIDYKLSGDELAKLTESKLQETRIPAQKLIDKYKDADKVTIKEITDDLNSANPEASDETINGLLAQVKDGLKELGFKVSETELVKESKEIITESDDEPVYYNILHGENNRYTLLVKTSKRLKGKESDIDDTVLMKLINALEEKELIDLDTGEDLEFGHLIIERNDVAEDLIKMGFTCYDLTKYKFNDSNKSELVKLKKRLQKIKGYENEVNDDWADDIETAFYKDSGGQGFNQNIIKAMGCENKADVIKLIDILLDKLNLKESKEVKTEAVSNEEVDKAFEEIVYNDGVIYGQLVTGEYADICRTSDYERPEDYDEGYLPKYGGSQEKLDAAIEAYENGDVYIIDVVDKDDIDNIDYVYAYIYGDEDLKDYLKNEFTRFLKVKKSLPESKKIKTEAEEKMYLDGELSNKFEKEVKLDFSNADMGILRLMYRRLDNLLMNVYDNSNADNLEENIKTILSKADVVVNDLPKTNTLNEAFNLVNVIRSIVGSKLEEEFGYDFYYDNVYESKQIKTEIASRADKSMLDIMNKFIKKNKLDPKQYRAGTFRIRMKDIPPQEVAGIITEYNGMEYGFRYLAGQDIWTITLIQTGASVSEKPYDELMDAINDLPNIDKKIDEYVQTNGDKIDQMTDKFNYITKAIDDVYKAGSVPSLIKAVKNIKGLPENAVKDIIDRINNNLKGDFTVSDYEDVQDMVVAKLQKIKEFNESKRIVTESVDPNSILKLFASKFNTSVQKNIYGDKYVEIPKEALQKQFPDMNITASSLSEVKQLATENGFKFNQKITNLNDDVIYGYVKEDVNLDITDADLVIMVFCYK